MFAPKKLLVAMLRLRGKKKKFLLTLIEIKEPEKIDRTAYKIAEG